MQNIHIVQCTLYTYCTLYIVQCTSKIINQLYNFTDKPNIIIAIANQLSCRNSEFIIPNNINAEITCNIF